VDGGSRLVGVEYLREINGIYIIRGCQLFSRSNIALRRNCEEAPSHGDATCRLGRHKGRKYKTFCGTFADILCVRRDRGNGFVGCEELFDYLELCGRGME
jgi:hypothetical protein